MVKKHQKFRPFLIAIVYAILSFYSVPALAADPIASESITNGVTEIAVTGVPGPLCVFGENVESVITGGKPGREMVLVAAANAKNGRIVAFGHNGYFGGETLEKADTAQCMENAIRWAADSTTSDPAELQVGTLQGDRNGASLAHYLSHNDWKVFELRRNNLAGDLARVDVFCLDPDALRSDAEIATVQKFIENGGGCVAVSLGWGWLQLNNPRTIYEHPGNRLFGKYGICWADGSCESTTPQGYRVAPTSPYVNAATALASLSDADFQPDKNTQNQISSILSLAANSIPLDSPWRERLRQFDSGTPLIPTPQRPIVAQNVRERLQMTLQIQQMMATPVEKITAHPAGDVFPGKCGPASSEPITITIDPTKETGWKSLGLYAAPGAKICITTPENIAQTKRFAIRIGCHTDSISHLDSWQRYPQITREFPINTIETIAANAFGGLLYFVVPERNQTIEPFNIQITGATTSPHYVAEVTTEAEWTEQLEKTTAPWGEIESNRVVLSLPTYVLKRVDPTTLQPLTTLWDQAMAACDRLASVQKSNRKWRYVPDLQISAGYMHSGYPIMLPIGRDGILANRLVDLKTLTTFGADEVWGFFHEVGHNYQSSLWTTPGKGEVTCNWFSLYVIEEVCGVKNAFEKKVGNIDHQKSIKRRYIENGRNFNTLMDDPFLYLLMDYQLKQAFGWDAFVQVTASYWADMATNPNTLPKNDAEKIDQFMIRFSKAVGKNLAPFFDDWGVPISDAARQQVAELPKWKSDF